MSIRIKVLMRMLLGHAIITQPISTNIGPHQMRMRNEYGKGSIVLKPFSPGYNVHAHDSACQLYIAYPFLLPPKNTQANPVVTSTVTVAATITMTTSGALLPS